MQAELLVDARAELGEGPLWDERNGVLYWVDIMGSQLHRYNPLTQVDEVFDVGQHVGTVVLNEADEVFVAVKNGFARFDLATEKLEIIADPESHLPNNRFNEGKAGPGGRFWAGTMSYNFEPRAGSLYCMETDGTVSKKESAVTISNGIVWSQDHTTMYYIDTVPRVVTAYDYDKSSGNISNGRVIIKVPEDKGAPDGMAIDEKGHLWIAHWGYGAVICWDPSNGEQLAEIKVPASQVSACAFGGDDMRTLYITTAWTDFSAEQLEQEPLAGGLFAARTEVAGLPSYRYGGR